MTDYEKYDADVDKFMDELDAEFAKVTEEQLEYANKQNNSFIKVQGRFADNVNGINLRGDLVRN